MLKLSILIFERVPQDTNFEKSNNKLKHKITLF